MSEPKWTIELQQAVQDVSGAGPFRSLAPGPWTCHGVLYDGAPAYDAMLRAYLDGTRPPREIRLRLCRQEYRIPHPRPVRLDMEGGLHFTGSNPEVIAC